MTDTIAIKWLRAQGVAFEVLEYNFTQVGADRAAEGVGRPLEIVCKTLIVEASGRKHWIAIVPGDVRFDPRKMAKAIGADHADLAETADAEKITGYQVGGISPFALRRPLPAVIEETLLAVDALIVNGGRRGVLLEMATADIVRLLAAKPADICR